MSKETKNKSIFDTIKRLITFIILLLVVIPILYFAYNKINAVYNILFSSSNKEVLLEKQKLENKKLDEALKIQKEFNKIDKEKVDIDKEVINNYRTVTKDLDKDSKKLLNFLENNGSVVITPDTIVDKSKKTILNTISKAKPDKVINKLKLVPAKHYSKDGKKYRVNRARYRDLGKKNYAIISSMRKIVINY